ncbi:MAG: class I SAM-dependent methyltransferase [Halohasta sp.]
MEVPCIAIPREDGEEGRQALADAGVLDDDYQIVNDEGTLFIPVTDPTAVPDRFETTLQELPARQTVKTPADVLGYEPSLERLGDVVIVDEDDPDRADEIAEAVMASDLPARSVLNRASKIKGELRVRDWEVLAEREDTARSPTETVHREYGHEFLVDLAAVYFSPRLATERHRVVDQIQPGERVLDMFAGVGPFAIPAASRGAEVVAVDLNETAVDYCRENARRNGVCDSLTAISGDVREVASDYYGWADRLVMNLPHSAGAFLDTAVDLAGEECVIHYYDIQHDSDPFGPGIEAIQAAAEPAYDVTVETEHVVRSYAPHEVNVCLDVRLTRSEANC